MKRTSLPCGCARACFLPALVALPLGCHVFISVDSSDQNNARLAIRTLVPTAMCPACGIDYRQRLRCLAHLSDKRRGKCATWVLEHCAPLPPEQVEQLDREDKALRLAAQRDGHSHHLARLPALRPDGRPIGRTASAA